MLQKEFSPNIYTMGTTARVNEPLLQDENRSPRSREAEQWKELAILFEDVIHELNQPVAKIGLANRTALKYFEQGKIDDAKRSLKNLSLAVKELGERIGVYKALTQRSNVEETVRVADIIKEVEMVLHPQADKAKVKIEVQIADNNKYDRLLYLNGDPFLFRMAIRALIHNAIQACTDKSIPQDRRHVIVRGLFSPSKDNELRNAPYGWTDIYVRDKGAGILPEIRQRIFERGFTTKKGRGLGLGLSLVQSVTEYYNGRIKLEENVSPGVEFWLRFPAALPPFHQK